VRLAIVSNHLRVPLHVTEVEAAGADRRVLRTIARNLLAMAQKDDLAALAAIREIGDRLDGKPKQETEVSLKTALARELTDDDLAALAVGASIADKAAAEDPPEPTPGKSQLN
jgi:hypothetical protein